MAEVSQPRPVEEDKQEFGFKNIQLFKTETLGTGAYGAVYKAKCDELICAAKLLHPNLFGTHSQPPEEGREHRQPAFRFELECSFLSRINHPNIVQYLGTYHDPNTNAPVLLMELMDDSLTHFLESSSGPIPYHVQVNLCYDIAQALAFLHSNGIIHRDLSSNNVLLLSNRAKVTDFGMSRFINVAATRLATVTQCPGTLAFMPPEALNEPPECSESLDNFSLGVVIVQVVTRKFPGPTKRFETRELVDPRIPTHIVRAQVAVPEAERRHAHISLIDPTHRLLPIALHCLKDKDTERPSSQQLCQSLASLKETAMKEGHSQFEGQVEELNVSQADTQWLTERLIQPIRDNEAKERQLRRLKQQIESHEEITAALQHTITQKEREVSELQCILSSKNDQIRDFSSQLEQLDQVQHNQQATAQQTPANLVCGSLPDALVGLEGASSTVDGNVAYFKPAKSRTIFQYQSQNNQWFLMLVHPLDDFTIVCVDHVLTTVGGKTDGLFSDCSNAVYSLIDSKWVKHFPPMQAKRKVPAAVYTESNLVVAGGIDLYTNQFAKIEVLNTQTKQWCTASSLPFKMAQASAAVCGEHIFLTAGHGSSKRERYSVLKCSLKALVQPKQKSSVWEKIALLPGVLSSLVTVNGRLLVVGGRDHNDRPKKDILEYEPATNSWNFVGQTTVARSSCLTAVLPGNKLMVIGDDNFEITKFEFI